MQHAESDADVTHEQPEPDLEFGAYYYEHDCGLPYHRNDHWMSFFKVIAERIQSDLAPTTVLDAGCAFGMLVEQLRERGIEAYGVDVSEYAISQVHESVEPYCRQASLTEPLTEHYDLITCVEVIEHIPGADADRAIENLCAASDRILFSSSPHDYGEPTHVNVRQPEEWAAAFARHGFVRNLDADVTFLTDWAVLYERATAQWPNVVRSYERALIRLEEEVRQLRSTAVELQGRLESDYQSRGNLDTQRQLLESRDQVIGLEAQLGEALGELRQLEGELSRYEAAADKLDKFTRSPVWRIYQPYDTMRSKWGRRLRALLSKFS